MDSTVEELYGSSDQHQRARAQASFAKKGRRTKRQRTATSSYGGGAGGFVDNSYGSSESATPSMDEVDVMSEVTTEEEDMANCLILLAQGIVEKKRRSSNNKFKTNIISNSNNINNNNTSSTSGFVGVYECKTCNRTFPSFQALGGHRTSHKKVKPITVPITPQPPQTTSTMTATATTTTTTTTTVRLPKIEDHDRVHVRDHDLAPIDDVDGASHDSSPLPSSTDNSSSNNNNNKNKSIMNNNRNNNNNNNNNNNSNNSSSSNAKLRVHECSICGSEFPSGQALGGHMRRHRPITPVVATDSELPPIAAVIATTTTAVIDLGGPRNLLSLDLNLPAPDHDEVDNEDSHMVETKFHVLSTPALVDCHY